MAKRHRTSLDVWTQRGATSYGFPPDADGDAHGAVGTPDGYVLVTKMENASNPDGFGPTTLFRFIWYGHQYSLRYNQRLSDRGSVRVAARFARDVANGRISP